MGEQVLRVLRRAANGSAQPGSARSHPDVTELLAALPRPTEEVRSFAESAGLMPHLRALADCGALEDCLVDADRGTALLVTQRPRLRSAGPSTAVQSVLRPDVFLRPARDGHWVLARPGSPSRILATAAAAGRLLEAASDAPTGAVPFVQLLADEGFLRGRASEDEAPMEFHDALFHSATSLGLGTDRGYGALPAPRAAPAAAHARAGRQRGGPTRPLHDGPGALSTPPFHDVLLTRRSCRRFLPEALDDGVLDALLTLSLRSTGPHPLAPRSALAHTYPNAGGLGAITTVVASAYPRPTLAHYADDTHALHLVESSEDLATETLRALCRPCDVRTPPALGLVFAADYALASSRYAGIAYANLLRDVGVLYQTVALSATALGLGSCPVGGGWGTLETTTLTDVLDGRVIVGAMLVGRRDPGA